VHVRKSGKHQSEESVKDEGKTAISNQAQRLRKIGGGEKSESHRPMVEEKGRIGTVERRGEEAGKKTA